MKKRFENSGLPLAVISAVSAGSFILAHIENTAASASPRQESVAGCKYIDIERIGKRTIQIATSYADDPYNSVTGIRYTFNDSSDTKEPKEAVSPDLSTKHTYDNPGSYNIRAVLQTEWHIATVPETSEMSCTERVDIN